ncbi:META and DUF4377 domain-containing protein [Archangium lansingense]|uniref:META and DUF4377 domain-containing protein n=2 Tax=Archangium lansingense TaxID=2995310 RepID=A0ABT4AEC7_9BACT|nr:META and DUF4377 domain-containing protein [Archangium lansinium]MCY1079269.1 META and DUF4377 domain-containing protein [Archangium lansinium]
MNQLRSLSRNAWQPLCAALALALLAGCATTGQGASNTSSSTTQLSAHHWQLQRVTDAQGQPQDGWQPAGSNGQPARPVQLDFSQNGMLSVTNLCNQLSGRYTVQGSSLKVEQMMSTRRACLDENLMALEGRVGAQLKELTTWRVLPQQDQAPQLELGFHDGSTWLLQGQPTHETLYGGPGTIEFWEVAPQRQPCTGVAPAECLKVRQVVYDRNGVKESTGDWQLFHGEIEGYRHEPGVRNVLRLKRYERRQVPADASRYVYVLDLVVESEQVGH